MFSVLKITIKMHFIFEIVSSSSYYYVEMK